VVTRLPTSTRPWSLHGDAFTSRFRRWSESRSARTRTATRHGADVDSLARIAGSGHIAGMGSPPQIHGHTDAAFAAVGEAFRTNFEPSEKDPGDLGAALCVIIDGRRVVDLWGGWADLAGTRPWGPDTLVNAYSIGKAMTSFTVLATVPDGLLDLDAPVASVWPEFGAHGKHRVTLREAMSHRAAVAGIDRRVEDDEVFSFDRITTALAETEPWWEPGSTHGYHVNTLGH